MREIVATKRQFLHFGFPESCLITLFMCDPFFISCLLYVTSFILHFWERRLEAVWPSYELHLSNLGLESFKVEHKTWKAKIWKSETEQVKGSIKNKTSAWKKWTYDRHTKAIYSTEKVKVKIWKATQTDIFCEIVAT